MLSIVIMNHNDEEYIIPLLRSIAVNTTIQYEIVIVDNDSRDGSAAILRYLELNGSNFLWQIHRMTTNAGYARANNAGIRVARYGVVLLLNPDTLIVDDSLDRCYKLFKASKFAACGVQLYNRDGSPQISANYVKKGGLNYLLPLPVIGIAIKKLGNLFGVKKPNVEKAGPVTECDWINGAFIMIWSRLAGNERLDEDFFLYAEESEWCSRIKKYHGRLAVFGDCKVIHYGGGTTEREWCKSPKGYYDLYTIKGRQLMLSNLLRIRKQFGIFWFLVILFFYTLAIPLAWSKRFASNVLNIWAHAFKIISGKPHFYKTI